MVFSSPIFLFAFLPLVLAAYYFIGRRGRNIVLLAASLLFYAWGEPRFVGMLLVSIAANYLFGLGVSRAEGHGGLRRAALIGSVLYNLSVFFVFKYWDFTMDNLNRAFGLALPLRNIALPIGISFFTFQAMSYVFDVYRGRGAVQKNILNVALYVSFFPQLIAGPIVRYETVDQQIRDRRESLADFSSGIVRFTLGLSKKAILANTIASVADGAFAAGDLTTSVAWLGALAYAFQIYFDFSGYSDMAIGLGLMFGFRFEENFRHPYTAHSITDFWRRWHISLGTWFRDYVYIPMGGSRVSRARLVLNLFVVWLLTGIWHGASWNFVVWGLFYFVLLSGEKLLQIPGRLQAHALPRAAYRLFTLLCVLGGWVLFRAETLPAAGAYLQRMIGLGGPLFQVGDGLMWRQYLPMLLGMAVLSLPIGEALKRRLPKDRAWILLLSRVGCLILLIVAIAFVVGSTNNPFIYFNF